MTTRPPNFFRDAQLPPPKGLDRNGYPVKPAMRWRKADNGRTLPLNSAAWGRLRRQVLTDEPLCRHCAAQGLVVVATEVDHMRGADDCSRDALQPLCKPCHSIKTMAELYGRTPRMGCDMDGRPLDPMHHWNEAIRADLASPGHGAEPEITSG